MNEGPCFWLDKFIKNLINNRPEDRCIFTRLDHLIFNNTFLFR